MKDMPVTDISELEDATAYDLPFAGVMISAGFPSPADDYIDNKLDLNKFLIKHPAATYFVRVEGDSMTGAGIRSGDILIVDRALEASEGDIAVAVLNGEFTVKRVKRDGDRLLLAAENPEYEPLEVTPEMDFDIWGVVTYVIHEAR